MSCAFTSALPSNFNWAKFPSFSAGQSMPGTRPPSASQLTSTGEARPTIKSGALTFFKKLIRIPPAISLLSKPCISFLR